jgi:hypothetical protein
MTRRAAWFVALALLTATTGEAQQMTISPNASRQATKGAAENFPGAVFVDPLFSATDHPRATGGHVTFTPGARSAWHTHPAGQFLIITDGVGWVQEWNGQKTRGQRRGRRVDAARREALARRHGNDVDAPHRDSGNGGGSERDLAGARDRRGVRQVMDTCTPGHARPTIICHMVSSIDGRLLAGRWTPPATGIDPAPIT